MICASRVPSHRPLPLQSSRSSRSTRSCIPQVWRPIAVNKQPPPRISFVVTEPEQGAPLASVASQLPASALSSSDNPTIRGSRLTRQASASTSTAESTGESQPFVLGTTLTALSDPFLDDNQSTISMSDSSNRPHSENHDRRRINRRRILFPPRLVSLA